MGVWEVSGFVVSFFYGQGCGHVQRYILALLTIISIGLGRHKMWQGFVEQYLVILRWPQRGQSAVSFPEEEAGGRWLKPVSRLWVKIAGEVFPILALGAVLC